MQDRYLLRVLLVAYKNALTRKWLKTDISTINDWNDFIYIKNIMERITFTLRTKTGLNAVPPEKRDYAIA